MNRRAVERASDVVLAVLVGGALVIGAILGWRG